MMPASVASTSSVVRPRPVNLDNTWRVSYIVSLYSGPRRESHFGFNMQIEARGF